MNFKVLLPAQQRPAAEDIDSSCRLPLFVLFIGAVFWLALASALDLVSSITFHSPNFLADCPWLTYGRVHAAAVNALLYGFALQAGFGVALRIIAQLGASPVAQPWLVVLGGKIWNLGVLVGVLAILAGDNTGFDTLQMPRYAALILFVGSLLVSLWTVRTLHNRRDPDLSPPQYFLLTALLWFPWIYSTANLLLLVCPVRGVEQSLIHWWYTANLTVVWLSLVGLAAVFCFLNKSASPPSGSGTVRWGETPGEPQFVPATSTGVDYRPLFVFWTLILFGSWVGIPGNAPVPAWMPTLSTIATVLLIIPLLTVAVMIGVKSPAAANPSLPFLRFGVVAWLVAGAMMILSALPATSPFTRFTWFVTAQSCLNLHGFFAMTMSGAIYCIVPRVAGLEWPLQKAVRAHFWFAATGILLVVLPLAIGGVLQGVRLNNAQIGFMELTRATLPFLRVSTLGSLFLLLGYLLLLANLLGVAIQYFRIHFVPVFKSVTRTPAPTESNS